MTDSIEKFQYSRLAPVGKRRTLQDLLTLNKGSITQLLPKHVSAEKLTKTLFVAVTKSPDLLKCTQESIVECVMRSAELGLDLSGTLGEAYMVPFNTTVKWHENGQERQDKRLVATFIPGYRGLAKLARQSGEVAAIDADVIRERDLEVDPSTGFPRFIYEKGDNARLVFRPELTGEERGRPVGAYAFVKLKDGSTQSDYMTKKEIEVVRNRARSKNSPAWKDHWEEMAKKTVFRRMAKWLPLSGERFLSAVEDDNLDFESAIVADNGRASLVAADLGPSPEDPGKPPATPDPVQSGKPADLLGDSVRVDIETRVKAAGRLEEAVENHGMPTEWVNADLAALEAFAKPTGQRTIGS